MSNYSRPKRMTWFEKNYRYAKAIKDWITNETHCGKQRQIPLKLIERNRHALHISRYASKKSVTAF